MFSKLVCVTLLLAVLGQTTALLCSDVTTVANLDLTQFRDEWVAVEFLPLPTLPIVPLPPSPRCVSVTGDSAPGHVTLRVRYYLSEELEVTRIFTFNVSASEPGRWIKSSEVITDQSQEILVVAANSDKFLVLLHCNPGQDTNDLMPVRVSFLSKLEHEEHHVRLDHVFVTEDELKILRADVAKILGLTTINTIKLQTDCFD